MFGVITSGSIVFRPETGGIGSQMQPLGFKMPCAPLISPQASLSHGVLQVATFAFTMPHAGGAFCLPLGFDVVLVLNSSLCFFALSCSISVSRFSLLLTLLSSFLLFEQFFSLTCSNVFPLLRLSSCDTCCSSSCWNLLYAVRCPWLVPSMSHNVCRVFLIHYSSCVARFNMGELRAAMYAPHRMS